MAVTIALTQAQLDDIKQQQRRGETGDSGSGEGGGGGSQSFPETLNYAQPWAFNTDFIHTSGFGPNTTLIVGFMIPTDAPAGQKGRASGAEYLTGPSPRNACINTVAGSFDSPIQSTSDNPSPLFWLEVGKDVQPGVTYYMNIRNAGGSGAQEMSCQVTIVN